VLIKDWFAYASPVCNFIHCRAVVTSNGENFKRCRKQERPSLIAR
jgi:hypothetical protein